jgi:hypothetical protein
MPGTRAGRKDWKRQGRKPASANGEGPGNRRFQVSRFLFPLHFLLFNVSSAIKKKVRELREYIRIIRGLLIFHRAHVKQL